jgi:hypothetical protein
MPDNAIPRMKTDRFTPKRTRRSAAPRSSKDLVATPCWPLSATSIGCGRKLLKKFSTRSAQSHLAGLAFALFAATTAAHAESLPVPMPERGGSCPHGYFRSAGFCVPREGAQQAIPERNGNCPHGWTASGSFCLRSGRRHECYHGLSRCF